MTVIMIAEAPGMDATFANGLLEAGIADEMVKAAGFVSHSSGASSTGYRVVEVWESREAHQAWFDDHVAPNLPPDMGPIEAEYIDVVLALPQA